MKIWALILPIFFVSLSATGEEIRTFTNHAGQKIEARLLQVEHESVLIEREDRRQFRLPIVQLSEEDQVYVKRWPTLNALANEQTVEISTRRLRLNRREFREAPGVDPELDYRRTEEELAMQILINNRATYDLENIQVEYRIFKDKADLDRDVLPRRMVIRGKIDIEKLPRLERSTEQTAPFILISVDRQEWGPANPLTGLYSIVRFRRKDDFIGIWVRVMEGDKVIREVTSPRDLARRVNW